MKSYQYILLDWDGNLAKTLDVWLEAYRAPLEKRGYHLSDQDIAIGFGMMVKHLSKLGVTDADDVKNEADVVARQNLPNVELYPDSLEVLTYFREKNKHIALLTSSNHHHIADLLDKYNLKSYFDVIIAADDITEHKPHPEPLHKALMLLGGNTAEAIMIGDSDKDIGAAHNAGMDSILFYPTEHTKFYEFEKLEALKPTYIVSDFRDIKKIIT